MFWVETGPNTVLLDTPETLEKEESRSRFSGDQKKPSSVFKIDTSINKKKLPLPDGVTFKGVITQQAEEPVDTGVAYTHFFPHGVSEQTIIYLVDEADHGVTLVVKPINGKTRLFNEIKKKDEIFKPK
mgnify:CR=1 FL=1